MRLLALALIPAALSFPLPSVSQPFLGVTPAFGASESEDDLVGRGVKLRKEGDDQGARDLFRQAYDRFHTPRAAGQLGLAEQALGRWEEAEVMLKEALRAPTDPWVKKNYQALARDIQMVKGHIARIEILGQPEGAEIVVNGRKIGRLPLAAPVTTSAGEVDVEARALGYQPEVRKLNLVGGQYQQIVIRLQKDGPPSRSGGSAETTAGTTPALALTTDPTKMTTPENPPTGSGTRPSGAESAAGGGDSAGASGPGPARVVAKWSALGLAGAGLALGITSSVVRSNKLDEFGSAHGGGCVEKAGRAVDHDGVPVPECQSPLDTYHGMRAWQIAGFVSASVFAATWLALWLTEPGAPAGGSGANVARTPGLVCGPTNDLSGATCMLSL